MDSQLTSRQIWLAPAIIGVLSLIGLISALLADGFGDAISWLTLSIPIAATLWYTLNKRCG